MISSIALAKSCRGALWRSLHAGSRSLPKNINFPRIPVKPSFNHAAPLSTSQIVMSSAAAQDDHSHSRIWTAERFLSAGLVGLLPLAVAFPNPVLDYALALSMTAHVHWGIEAIVVDYIRPNIVGKSLAAAAVAGVYALTVLTLGGLFFFNYNDVGLGQAIRMLWKL